MEKVKLILDRQQWARGTRLGFSGVEQPGSKAISLLTIDKRMCCLGYLCAQQGATADDLDGLGEPWEIIPAFEDSSLERARVISCIPPYLVHYDEEEDRYGGALDGDFMGINDDETTSDEEKIIALNALALEHSLPLQVILVDTPEERAELGGLPADFAQVA